jgi:hypothetical protein
MRWLSLVFERLPSRLRFPGGLVWLFVPIGVAAAACSNEEPTAPEPLLITVSGTLTWDDGTRVSGAEVRLHHREMMDPHGDQWISYPAVGGAYNFQFHSSCGTFLDYWLEPIVVHCPTWGQEATADRCTGPLSCTEQPQTIDCVFSEKAACLGASARPPLPSLATPTR